MCAKKTGSILVFGGLQATGECVVAGGEDGLLVIVEDHAGLCAVLLPDMFFQGIIDFDAVGVFALRMAGGDDGGFEEMEPVDVVIRPEDITIVPASDEVLNGVVETVTFKGVHYEIVVNAYSDYWIVHSTKSANVGEVVGLSFTPEDIHIMKKSEMPKITRYTVGRSEEA